MSDRSLDLYELLPVLYRLRDVEQGYPLRALLEIIAEQAGIVKYNIDGLWDDFFVETCDEWVIPYTGDLIGNNPLHPVAARRRADVARTIYYRRRKGTLPMLEELARDVTGWHAHAVAFFELLGWTQNLNHLRYQMAPNPQRRDPNGMDRVGTVNLRNLEALDRLDGPFDTITHTVDVRPISYHEGWHNIRKVGFFLWRLRHYPLNEVTARRSAQNVNGYHFSPLGNPAPLFNDPRREADESGLAREIHVPGPIRPTAFYFDMDDYYPDVDDYLSVEWSLAIYGGPTADVSRLVSRKKIICKDLSNWATPPTGKVAVDVQLGRLAFAPGEAPTDGVTVRFNYGFSADMGGGPYRRLQTLTDPAQASWRKTVDQRDPGADFKSLSAALAAWAAPTNGNKANAVITILDSRTYIQEAAIEPANNGWLVIQAADGKRPVVRFENNLHALSVLTIRGGNSPNAALTLNGLAIEGGIQVRPNSLGHLRILHCTLVPGRGLTEEGRPQEPDQPSLTIEAPNDRLRVDIDHSIVGALRLPAEISGLSVQDSIIDGGGTKLTAALLSGNLAPFPTLSTASPSLDLTIGGEGPHKVELKPKPASLADARDRLQEGIRAAHSSREFSNARVILAANRLVVLPGVGGVMSPLSIAARGADPTAAELRLTGTFSRRVQALVTSNLAPFPTLSSASPRLNVTIGGDGPREGVLAALPGNIAEARDRLQEAIRAAGSSPGFADALVARMNDQLVVLPGSEGAAATFSTAATDQSTLVELGLESYRPAITGNQAGSMGPSTSLERTTVFGSAYVKELSLASEVIFIGRVVSQRLQSGCLRFSYVPEDSRTPRRYRCQADEALGREAEALGLSSADKLSHDQRQVVLSRLRPAFTSVHYGDPGYAQLSLRCPEEIRTGAEDGSEMGAFCSLKQPQRESNLRIRLEEYLPFGLDPGLIFVT